MTASTLSTETGDVQMTAATEAKDDPRAASAALLETRDKRPPAGLAARLVRTPDGVDLRCATARPPTGARGTVVILTGRGDYIERHYELIGELLRRRYAVAIFDWRGQGLSQRLLKNRLKGHVHSFEDYETDLETVMRQVALPDLPPPHYAFAVSMGGHILLKASWKHMWFDRAMLISPMVAFPRHPRERWLRLLVRAAPYLGIARGFFPGLPQRLIRAEDAGRNALTTDIERFLREVRFLREHPQAGLAAAPTLGWMKAALDSIRDFERMVAGGGEPRWPMLALAASRDTLVDPEALRRLVRQVGNIKATFLHKARHDITIERDENRALMWAAFDSFMTAES